MTLKSKLAHKNIDTVKTKLLSCKHNNGNINANNKRKSEHDNTKMHKMSWHNVKNNNGEKIKHLRRNVPFEIKVKSSPHATDKLVSTKKRFARKFKNEYIKLVCATS